jgi:hypothetical protein
MHLIYGGIVLLAAGILFYTATHAVEDVKILIKGGAGHGHNAVS